jgi:hypothetical protein
MYTPPNRYWATANWKLELRELKTTPGTWEFDLQRYEERRQKGRTLMEAWTEVRMSVVNAKHALVIYCPNEWNHSSLIPPEIFSRVLARSMATHIDPNDDVPVVLEDEPASCVDPHLHLWMPNRASAKVAKRKTPKRKIAKGAKRKTAKARRRS